MATHYDDALHMMEAIGGSFVRSLAACYYAADPDNKARLRGAFEGYFDTYERKFRRFQETSAAGANGPESSPVIDVSAAAGEVNPDRSRPAKGER